MFTHTFFPFPFLPLDRRLFLPTAICREETSGAQVRAAGLWPVHSWVSGVAPALQGRAGALPEPPAWHAAARAAAGGAGLHRGRRCGTSSDRLRLRQETWVGVSYIISALRSPEKKPSGLKLLKLLGGRARCPPPRHPPFAAANIRVSLASLLGRVQAPPHPLALRTGLACAPPGEHRRWTRATGQCARPRDALPDPGPGRRPELRKTASTRHILAEPLKIVWAFSMNWPLGRFIL